MNIRDRFAELWSPEDIVDSLWRIVASPCATVMLLAGIAALVLLGIIVPQRPAEAVAEPTSKGVWLAALRERCGDTTDWLLALRLVDIHHSLLLRALVGLLALNLLLRTADLLQPSHLLPAGALLLPASPSEGNAEGVSARPLCHGILTTTRLAESPDDLLARVRHVLQSHGYRLVESRTGDWFYADRFIVFVILVYLGLLFTIGGLALRERTSWWEENVILRPDQVRPLGHGTGLAVRAQSSDTTNDQEPSEEREGHATLTLLRDEQEVAQLLVHSRLPSLQSGLLFYHTATEPVLLVQAEDSEGRSLSLQTPETGTAQFTQVALRFHEEESPRYFVVLDLSQSRQLGRRFEEKGYERYVIVPAHNLSLRLLYSPLGAGESTATFTVEAFRDGETAPFYEQHFHTSQSIELAGARYTFKPQEYVVIRFGQDYCLGLVGLGVALVLGGLVLGSWRRPRRLWAIVQAAGGEVSLHVIRAPVEGKAPEWFNRLVQGLATTLALDMQDTF